ncbi:MAG: FtsW/RodA/SpoVE family cell cycle protein, partial [Chloroflexaceae bacterium]|nr:FtsW/RodA/SpoVE family cell cycle protein [Chloroflexaceae bacterium]
LSSLTLPLYLLTIGVLALVHLLGTISEGAQSWIALGTRTFQPSEFAKIALIMVLAAYWSHFEETRNHWLTQLGALVLAGIPILLILAQPDFGTGLVFICIWLTMAWGAGIRWYHLAVLAVLAVPTMVLGWQHVLDEEQKSRFLTFYWLLTDPILVDPNDGYNVIQSLKAIAAGGLLGAGLTRGVFSQNNLVPVQYSDFIFTVIGEEMGFIGALVVLGFLTILLWLVLSVAEDARDTFGQLIALGVFGMLISHTIINIGMAVSILPVTGLPLPFISYGGSFTITTLLAIGILQNIRMRRRKIVF